MKEEIKILEEFINNYKMVQEKYKDDEIQAEIERSCYFEEVPASAIESLLKAYKQDEKMIDLMAQTLLNYGFVLIKSKKGIIEFFRKKVEDE